MAPVVWTSPTGGSRSKGSVSLPVVLVYEPAEAIVASGLARLRAQCSVTSRPARRFEPEAAVRALLVVVLRVGREQLLEMTSPEVKGTNSPIGPLSWHSSASLSIICHGPPPVLLRRVPDLQPAEILPADSFGQGHRADGSPPRGPRAEASGPWPRPLPDHGPSDPRGAQPVASALALLSRHARDPAALAPGALEKQEASGNVGEPCEAPDVPRSAMSSSSSSSDSAGRTDAGNVFSSHSGRASRSRDPSLGKLDPPSTSTPRSRTSTSERAYVEGVPRRPGERHLDHRLLRRGHHQVHPALCTVRHRAPEPRSPHPRGHRSSDRLLCHPSCPQPRRGSRRATSVVPVLDPRPRRQVHRQLRQGVRL